jgi:phosphoribosylanthranilate isomerase
MKVKVCGMKDPGNIRQLDTLPVDLVGLIFHEPSPRHAGGLTGGVPTSIPAVGVFVNERLEVVLERVERHGLHAVQLHGDEPPAFREALRRRGIKVIKALHVETAADLRETAHLEASCDYLLFDAKTPGSGKKFDWGLLHAYAGQLPFLLGGGVGPGDAPLLRQLRHPLLHAVDVNSRFEVAPGVKDIQAIKQFIITLNA